MQYAHMQELPIACTLDTAEQARRASEIGALAARALIDAQETAGGARFEFRGFVEAELRDLIRAESECCPFLGFDLQRRNGTLVLDVSAPSEARPMVVALFGNPLSPT
jgi:hypothetical protein